MKWISIYHRMPEPYIPVLVCYSSGMMRVSYAVTENRKIRWANESRISRVTHWQPLPPQPGPADNLLNGEQAKATIGEQRISRSVLIGALENNHKEEE